MTLQEAFKTLQARNPHAEKIMVAQKIDNEHGNYFCAQVGAYPGGMFYSVDAGEPLENLIEKIKPGPSADEQAAELQKQIDELTEKKNKLAI